MTSSHARKLSSVRVLIVALLACAAVGLSGCGTTQESDLGSGLTPQRSTDECDSIPSYMEGTPSATLDRIASQLRRAANGNTQAPSGFAGIVMCGGSNTVLLFWKGALSAPVQAVIDDEAPHVVARVASYSAAELKAVISKVRVDKDYWKSQGVVVEAAGPAEQNGTSVHIGISGSKSPSDVQKKFDRRYGQSPIIVTEEPPSELL